MAWCAMVLAYCGRCADEAARRRDGSAMRARGDRLEASGQREVVRVGRGCGRSGCARRGRAWRGGTRRVGASAGRVDRGDASPPSSRSSPSRSTPRAPCWTGTQLTRQAQLPRTRARLLVKRVLTHSLLLVQPRPRPRSKSPTRLRAGTRAAATAPTMTASNEPELPQPVSAYTHRKHRPSRSALALGGHSTPGSSTLALLTQRARTTNLAVLLLAAVASVSVLVNFRVWLGDDVRPTSQPPPPPRALSDPLSRCIAGLSATRRLQRPRASLNPDDAPVAAPQPQAPRPRASSSYSRSARSRFRV